MPSILLINDNKIVSRLLQLSSKKNNYDLEEISNYEPSQSSYNVIFVDSHKYNSSNLKNLTERITYDKLGFIGTKNSDIPSEFDIVIEKPFLPTDFVTLIDENFKIIETPEEDKEIEKEDTLQLDELEEITSLDDSAMEEVKEIEPLDESALEEIESPLEEIMENDILEKTQIPATTLSTGIVNNFQDESEKEEISDMINEIDNMKEEPIEDLSLEDLKIDDSLDNNGKENIEEIEEEIDVSLASIIEEEETPPDSLDLSEEVIESEDTKEENKEESSSMVEDIATIASVAGLGAVASNILDKKEEEDKEDKEEEKENNMIDELNGIENIEKESDYLANDFNDLDEKDIEKVLGDEVDTLEEKVEESIEDLDIPIIPAISDIKKENEEIISEEISIEGEEKVIEPTDLEEMIQKAVADSITPELLQKALEGMDINLSLSFSPKNEEVNS